MNMLISSGEEFDVCFTTQSWLNKYQPNVSRGAFLALDDLIDEHAPDLKEVLPEFFYLSRPVWMVLSMQFRTTRFAMIPLAL